MTSWFTSKLTREERYVRKEESHVTSGLTRRNTFLPFRTPVAIGRTRFKTVHTDTETMTRNFMTAVENNNVNKVKRHLERKPELATIRDSQGRSSRSLAVQGGPAMLEPFINSIKGENWKLKIWIEYTILHAVSLDDVTTGYEATQYLLDEREKLSEMSIVDIQQAITKMKELESDDYPLYQTPVVLAAQLHKADIVKMLIERGESEIHSLTAKAEPVEAVEGEENKEKKGLSFSLSLKSNKEERRCPLGNDDDCEVCSDTPINESRYDVISSKRMLEVHKALSSPTFILNSGIDDPVLEAFRLSHQIKVFEKRSIFKEDYENVQVLCRQFACELLDLCRDEEELDTFLNMTDDDPDDNPLVKNIELRRVYLAISYEQKEFVAHPHCQLAVAEKWWKGLPAWVYNSSSRGSRMILFLLLWFLIWPVACILHMLQFVAHPHCQLAVAEKWWKGLPAWVYNSSSRGSRMILFLLLWFLIWPVACILHMLQIWTTFMKQPIIRLINTTISFLWFVAFLVIACTNTKVKQRASDLLTSPVEWLIVIWVVGMWGRILKARCHLIFNSCNCCSFSMLFKDRRRVDMLMLSCFNVWIGCTVLGTVVLYLRGDQDLERHKWNQWNPILIAEGFFSFGTVLAFFKLIGLLKNSQFIGPLEISLRRMFYDIVRFLIIATIAMTGFSMALTNIYSHYDDHVRLESDGSVTEQADDFVKWRYTYKTLFWSLFGYGNLEAADVVVGNTFPGSSVNGTAEIVKHKLTETYGYLLLGLFHVVVIIVMLNMLIAMMAGSYERIERNADTEWKFARTRLRMMYFGEIGSLPAPFNILLIGSLLSSFRKCCCKKEEEKTGEEGRKLREETESEKLQQYKALMDKLRTRYISKRKDLYGNRVQSTSEAEAPSPTK